MSSPNSTKGGGFHPTPQNMSLGYVAMGMRSKSPRRSATSVSLSPDPIHQELSSPATFTRHRPRRGMSFEAMRGSRIINNDERSITDFRGVACDEDDIKNYPRKLRPYYEKLGRIKESYAEVDALLCGELPAQIAQGFRSPPPHHTQSYSALDMDRPDETIMHSAWHTRTHMSADDDGVLAEDGEEVSERTPLILNDREARRERVAKLALHVNTVVNFLLVAAKAVAVYYSSSISLMASLVDSLLDLFSTFIIIATTWAAGITSDRHLYPAGKRRFEPLGVLIFSVVMIASFTQVFIESFNRVMWPNPDASADLSPIGMATMLATIAIKSVLWVWCSKIPTSAVQALAQDAENDVMLNIMSLAFPWLGSVLGSPLLDPIGGMVLSAYIIIEWIKTLMENFRNLSGRAASPEDYTRSLYMVTRFNPVLAVADCEQYHIGDDQTVEVDVILPNTTLHFAHDVAETIQVMLENLDGVVRAYVHADYSSFNPAQHRPRPPVATIREVPVVEFADVNGTGVAQSVSSSSSMLSATPTAANPFPAPKNGPGVLAPA